MPLDFPASPTVNQSYNGYVWSGVAWEAATPNAISLTGQAIVANQAARDALYPSPVQGNAVFRNDLGVEEIYYGLYNVSTNPGGRDTAGWYINDRTSGLIPVVPSSVVIASGSGSANALGLVTFTTATAVSLNGIFTSAYKYYRVMIDTSANSANSQLRWRMRLAGTDNTENLYYTGGVQAKITNTINPFSVNGENAASLGFFNGIFTSSWDIFDANLPVITRGYSLSAGGDATSLTGVNAAQYHFKTVAYDGLTILALSGNMTGTIQVFGYND